MSHKSVLTKCLPDKTSKPVLTKCLPDKTSIYGGPDKMSADRSCFRPLCRQASQFLFKSSFLGFAGRRSLSKSSTGHEVWRRPTVQVGNNSFCTFIGICDAKYSFFFSLIQPKAHFYARWPGFSWPRCPDCKRQKAFICQVYDNTLELLANTRNMNFANR